MDKRKKRTSSNQYLLYIDMMEKDPIFASGKVPRDVDLNYLTKKWKELSDKLNACGNGPTLTAEEWRKRLNDWKNTTRCKYRRSMSGEKDITMTNLEMRALELFGKAPNLNSTDQMIHLKSEKDDGEDEEQHASESFHKQLQAAVEEAIGGDDEEDGMVEEHVEGDEEMMEEQLNTSNSTANAVAAAETATGASETSAYRTIVVDNSGYVEEEPTDEQLEYITTRRNTVTAAPTNVQTVVTAAAPTTTKLINGGIPLKRLRTQPREQIVYEVKNTHVPQTHGARTYATIQTTSTPTPIAIHQNKNTLIEQSSHFIDTHDAREISHQLKRIADIKYEKLKFEIARFKFNNPGFHYNHPAL